MIDATLNALADSIADYFSTRRIPHPCQVTWSNNNELEQEYQDTEYESVQGTHGSYIRLTDTNVDVDRFNTFMLAFDGYNGLPVTHTIEWTFKLPKGSADFKRYVPKILMALNRHALNFDLTFEDKFNSGSRTHAMSIQVGAEPGGGNVSIFDMEAVAEETTLSTVTYDLQVRSFTVHSCHRVNWLEEIEMNIYSGVPDEDGHFDLENDDLKLVETLIVEGDSEDPTDEVDGDSGAVEVQTNLRTDTVGVLKTPNSVQQPARKKRSFNASSQFR